MILVVLAVVVLSSLLSLLLRPHCVVHRMLSCELLSLPLHTSRKQGDIMCIIVFHVYHRPVFSESPLGFGVLSGIY